MKYQCLLLVTSVVSACASNPPPPAASSETIDVATNTPSTASNEPIKTDIMLAAEADRKAEANASQAPANSRPAGDGAIASPQPPVAAAAPAPAAAPAAPVAAAPDNSRVNARDRSGDSLTAADQGGGEGDRKLTQQIRQAVMKNDSLSFTAKNVKIITVNGKVTLRGPVNTEQERSAIDAAARSVAGASHVENLIEIKK